MLEFYRFVWYTDENRLKKPKSITTKMKHPFGDIVC